jgi:carbon-monoxide dehydrogenase large subunit
LAADRLEADAHDLRFEDGAFLIAGTDRRIAFTDIVKLAGGVSAEAYLSAGKATFPNGCHIAEVEIDSETGSTRLVRYTVVDDVGRVINPMIVEGQILGGIAQGAGQALMEEISYDRASGQLTTASFMDYAMPRAEDLPATHVENVVVATSANPLGVKGVGEAGAVGALSAVMSAVADALSSAGVPHFDMPATPGKIWAALQAANEAGGA